jgi:ATP-dependent helicase/nuclease subunit A
MNLERQAADPGDRSGTAHEIRIIQAGAGSGKTYRLTEEVFEAIRDRRARPARILLTTFTRKAAAELLDRVSAKLVNEGLFRAAAEIREARIGTVHGVCGGLLRDYAFEAGLPVRQNVLDEVRATRLFRRSLTSVLTDRELDTLDRLSHRLSIDDWRKDVESIVKTARSNAISPDGFERLARANIDRIVAALGPEADGCAGFDTLLSETRHELERTASSLKDETKVTKEAFELLSRCDTERSAGHELVWADYLRLAGAAASKKSGGCLAPLNAAARGHVRWPEFRTDIAGYIELVFSLASRAFARYRELKEAAGCLDFEDQETRCLDLLERSETAPDLSFDLVLVDEFQDTSPIQLALFLGFARRAKRSIWVGDPKQAIYGFRGCDPELMIEAMRTLMRGVKPERLERSWRSVPALVEFVNSVFPAAFEKQGIDPESVGLVPVRDPVSGPALESWVLDKGEAKRISKEIEFAALASGIKTLLSDRGRPTAPSEVAVLARQNEHCAGIAKALAEAGIPFVLETAGLMREPAVRLVLAAYAILTAPGAGRFFGRGQQPEAEPGAGIRTEHARAEDTLVEAVISWFCENRDPAFSPESWLGERFRERERADSGKAVEPHPVVAALRAAQPEVPYGTPYETLRVAAEISGAWTRTYLSVTPKRHLSVLEQLFALASEYEESANDAGEPVTHAGLVSFLRELEENGEDKILPTGDDGVRILTWHGSKGLEWPVVVLYGIDQEPRVRFFGTQAVSGGSLDLERPLEGRRIMFNVYPYLDRQTKNCEYLELLSKTPEYLDAERGTAGEQVRLEYVAFTRARNRLIFASRRRSEKKDDADNESAATFPVPQDPDACPPGWVIREFRPADRAEPPVDPIPWYRYVDGERPPFEPKLRTPSSLTAEPGRFVASEPVRFSEPLTAYARGSARMALGTAVHRFFAVGFRDDPELGISAAGVEAESAGTDRDCRLEIARRLAAAADVKIEPESLVRLREDLERYIRVTWPGSTIHREFPVKMERGGRITEGITDLVAEYDRGFVVIDYKLVKADDDQADTYADRYGPQIEAYAEVLEAALGKRCDGMFLCLPFAGTLVRVTPSAARERTGVR